MRGKKVLITGASSGIGEATAKLLAEKGAEVILQARGEEGLNRVAQEIRDKGGTAHVYSVDLNDYNAINETAKRVIDGIGLPDVIINNAGIGRWLFIDETPNEEAEQMLQVPYLAAFHTTRAYIEHFIARNSGHVINLNSPACYLGFQGANAYTASRWALRGFTEALDADMKEYNIKVSMVVPGKVASNYFENNPGSEERLPKISVVFGTLTTEQVAKTIYKTIKSPRLVVNTPFTLAATIWFNRFFPGLLRWVVLSTGYKR